MKLKKIGKVIVLSKGEYVQVDEQDYEYLSRYKWYLYHTPKWNYAIRTEYLGRGVQKTIFMHREIMGIIDPKVYIDHKDHNGLNNRRENLRISDNKHNQYNTGRKVNSLQKYKNIRNLGNDKWQIRMRIPNGRRIERVVKGEKEAIKVYNDLAIKYHGEFAYLQKYVKS